MDDNNEGFLAAGCRGMTVGGVFIFGWCADLCFDFTLGLHGRVCAGELIHLSSICSCPASFACLILPTGYFEPGTCTCTRLGWLSTAVVDSLFRTFRQTMGISPPILVVDRVLWRQATQDLH